MCEARFSNGAFDPALCPLLAGLSPQEIADRLASDPMIRNCAGIGGEECVDSRPDQKAAGKRPAHSAAGFEAAV